MKESVGEEQQLAEILCRGNRKMKISPNNSTKTTKPKIIWNYNLFGNA